MSEPVDPNQSVRNYWESHNVTLHKRFSTVEESLNYLDWRNDQYIGYLELMPLSGKDGLTVLDYGCGPGHDLIGFATFSKPARLIGADISRVSLQEAEDRLKLHQYQAELITINPDTPKIELESESIDHISSSGVLHHIENEKAVLEEFYRILKKGGSARIMVYNYQSIWMHLYTAYTKRIYENKFNDVNIREAFARTTDGESCPIAKCYRPEEFIQIAESVGFKAKFLGAAISLTEMHALKDLHVAIMQPTLPVESRKFLIDLTFDSKLIPHYKGNIAGIDAVFELSK